MQESSYGEREGTGERPYASYGHTATAYALYLTLCIEIFKITNQGKLELRCILLVIHQSRFDVEVSLVFVESQA